MIAAFLLILQFGIGFYFGSSYRRGVSNLPEEDEEIALCRKLLEEIDSLIDDLEYDCSPEEREGILQKIEVRKKVLEKLL
jgi:hypothetical protein